MNRKLLSFFVLCVMAVAVFGTQAQVVMPPCCIPPEVNVYYHRVNIEVRDMIATTTVEMQFTNTGEGLAEGQFLFPLPQGAAVQELIMIVNGLEIEAKILRAEEARAIYDEIVRQYRDPALLEYIGRDLLQASVFPITAGESRQIIITYGQVLELENGLVKVIYPLNTPATAGKYVDQTSVRVDVVDTSTIGNVYSPSHRIAVSRPTQTSFIAGFEQNGNSEDDFVVYYGLQRDSISANLLTYRESSNQDGFFLLMIQPPQASETAIQAKDVVIVLDQSGSMQGEKWEQAVEATVYVLENLNPNDRFNVVPFSTGTRTYANELLGAEESASAVEWVRSLYPEGGTNISDALTTGLSFADAERPMSLIFLTDGLATEGIIDTSTILSTLGTNAPSNVRMFTFGVGDDVDTVLLDSLVRDFRGTSSYVRPGERINEEVASLYTKISSPVLNDITLTIDGTTAELLYPQQLPDLFAGEQLTLVGRYRSGGTGTITLTGKQGGETTTIVYGDMTFSDNAGGNEFIARLWATRRIGDLLNQIRLNGENSELVESVVSLSIRYGIITPYTSFLITEDDILTQQGQDDAEQAFADQSRQMSESVSGAGAVSAADAAGNLANANAPAPVQMQALSTMTPAGTQTPGQSNVGGYVEGEQQAPQEPAPIQYVGEKTFILQGQIWTDTTFTPDTMTPRPIVFLSDEYFDFLAQHPEAAAYFAVGEQVIVVIDGEAIQIVME